MPDSHHPKPHPARPQGGKPTPARALSGEPPVPSAESDVAEALVEVDGVPWTVRVQGRSGRASPTSAPLLLLGFWRDAETGGEPLLEAMVAGRTLGGQSPEVLEAALAIAKKPKDPARNRPFFQNAGQARRR
ncbi:MAG: hypothetical protein OEN00_10885 [Gemmatimonadota bacterium]|nr:hypothetical protein [Gemmatimonadota bacterium]